jgi:hypothetical protein
MRLEALPARVADLKRAVEEGRKDQKPSGDDVRCEYRTTPE